MEWIKKHQKFLWGIAVGAIAALLIINRHWFAPLHEPVMAVLKSNAITAFAGAFAGAFVVYLMNKFEQKKRLLADINASIGMLISVQNSLLNFKSQHVVPMVENHSKALLESKKQTEKNQNSFTVSINVSGFLPPSLNVDLPTKSLFSLTHLTNKLVPIIEQTRKTTKQVIQTAHMWNKDLLKLQAIQDQDAKCRYYLGLPYRDGAHDTQFVNVLDALEITANSGLFFTRRSIEELIRVGKEELPRRFHGRIIRPQLLNKEDEDLMPPHNYVEGWD